MTAKTHPAQNEYICDGCMATVTDPSHRPYEWGGIIVQQTAFDWQGQAAADATVKRDFCPKCLSEVVELLNDWCIRKRKEDETTSR